MPERAEELTFVRRTHRVRTLVYALSLLPIGSVLHQLGVHPWFYALLIGSGFVWPHLAWLHAMRAKRPVHHEHANMLADSAILGAWIAAMQFNVLPSVMLASLTSMDRISVGGPRLLLRATLVGAASCLLAAWANGFAWHPESNMLDIYACTPLLIVYPIWLSLVNRSLEQRIRRQNRLLEQLGRTDGLTGIANRMYWYAACEREWQRFRRNRRPASLLLLDIDHFKTVNDQFGHVAGDAVLKALAEVLRGNVRALDVPGRFGGDEFGVVLPETDAASAMEVAERIRRDAGSIGVDDGLQATVHYTVSIGIAEVDAACTTAQAWVERADAALYQAKACGRNHVCTAAPATPHATAPVDRAR